MVCNSCGARFEQPRTVMELRGEFWGTPAYERYVCCPFCLEEDISDDW